MKQGLSRASSQVLGMLGYMPGHLLLLLTHSIMTLDAEGKDGCSLMPCARSPAAISWLPVPLRVSSPLTRGLLLHWKTWVRLAQEILGPRRLQPGAAYVFLHQRNLCLAVTHSLGP